MDLKNKVFDLADVFVHNNDKDCWVIINARVYDVTNFLNDHPGGNDVLLAVAGKNASEEFEEAGHGSAARLMLDEYYVGEVDHMTPSSDMSKTTTSKLENYLKQQSNTKEDKQPGSSYKTNSVVFLLSLTILGVATGFVLCM
ncbi:cytochrome b5-like [Cynara cardunculus var. scolymus]|uniref:Cytochrome b5, heme-binding site-containing protein n=1 Tax=Cynara cardunculus var. scolymus TaxID=59895 RepID=A0A103XHU9_CYNCS|nr:cytochrome b5-like [Cynara cardunculus var. scolymus]KVH90963.1 cytochrome b5, heme-binding site-containing protein [Cynara cardunculus var. scolymus]